MRLCSREVRSVMHRLCIKYQDLAGGGPIHVTLARDGHCTSDNGPTQSCNYAIAQVTQTLLASPLIPCGQQANASPTRVIDPI